MTSGLGESSIRMGGTYLRVPNSGLEVWLYDDANRESIRTNNARDSGFGGMPPGFQELTRDGVVVGYSLQQDDDLEIAVHVGDPLTDRELSVARWLEPQTAMLRLPSGMLCVESNDASRIGPEQPTEKGGVVIVPAGDYRLTLYRIDHEALYREAIIWPGPMEVVVLTPGGSTADATDDLLPFEPRWETEWVGQYTIDGKRVQALAWFDNPWDMFLLNLDSAAISKLELVPGSYLRTHIPSLGLTLISTFAKSWDDAQRLPPPDGVELDEYGYAALHEMQEWNRAEALMCRRETSKTRVEHQHHGVWVPAAIDVLDANPRERLERAFALIELRTQEIFNSSFLAIVLSNVLPDTEDMDELPLPVALDMLDDELTELGLTPQGDLSWDEQIRVDRLEMCCRLYSGLADLFAAIVVADGSFELVFLTELDNGNWVVTGLADEIDRRIMTTGPDGLPVPHPRVQLQAVDESLQTIFATHQTALGSSEAEPIAAPQTLEECMGAFGRFLAVAFD